MRVGGSREVARPLLVAGLRVVVRFDLRQHSWSLPTIAAIIPTASMGAYMNHKWTGTLMRGGKKHRSPPRRTQTLRLPSHLRSLVADSASRTCRVSRLWLSQVCLISCARVVGPNQMVCRSMLAQSEWYIHSRIVQVLSHFWRAAVHELAPAPKAAAHFRYGSTHLTADVDNVHRCRPTTGHDVSRLSICMWQRC